MFLSCFRSNLCDINAKAKIDGMKENLAIHKYDSAFAFEHFIRTGEISVLYSVHTMHIKIQFIFGSFG